jgi:hypothetical protein
MNHYFLNNESETGPRKPPFHYEEQETASLIRQTSSADKTNAIFRYPSIQCQKQNRPERDQVVAEEKMATRA